MQVPAREEFLKAAGEGRPVPVYRDVLADIETPLSAYWKLAEGETFSFLLESVTGGEQLARYSILGARPRLVLRSKGRQVRRIARNGESRDSLPEGSDPLDALKGAMASLFAGCRTTNVAPDSEPHSPFDIRHSHSDLPKFLGGAVGMLSYDYVRFLERLPDGLDDELEVDDMAMMLTESVVVFDHAKNLMRIIVVADPTPEAYDEACAEIERIVARLRRPLPELPRPISMRAEVESNQSPERFEEGATKAIEYIAQGDCIQVVLSQCFSTECRSHPLTVYRALRSLNPSPYMFLLRFGDFDLVGASPELLVSLQGETCRVRPIAGTRQRGATPEEDKALEAELLADEKERAEHIMLVDLGRNDLGRVSEYGSVKVNELMVVERYSHVMHIVSDVTGTLAEGKDAIDLLRACFPAGTVSGAPKVRAMQLIDEMEPSRRGPYAGSVGYVSLTGDMDMAITIRTILLKNGKAYVQSGAGIVYDSVPESELKETESKARASLRAIELAHQASLMGP